MKILSSRRTFIKKSSLAGLAIPILGASLFNCNSKYKNAAINTQKSPNKLKILILGGTSFLGPHQIAYAISRGHEITTFTRGKTLPTIHTEVFKNVEQLIGDREDNLTALENRKWDVVIDNSGRKVEWTKATANLLNDHVGLYMYTSSTGVYFPYKGHHITEDTSLVLEMPDGLTEDQKYEQDYGVMKANSEIETIKAFGKNRSTIVRPTYMLGPGDKTDRFVHWPIRLSKGGDILVPGKQDDLVQYVDIRDVAEWFIRLAENKQHGTFNAVGPKVQQTTLQFAKEAAKTFDVKSTFTLIDDYEFLKSNGVYYAIPWVMPEGDHYGSARLSNSRALEAGLTYRNLTNTIKDAYTWWNSDAVDAERKINYEQNPNALINKEKEILELWNKK